jgi:hypothetical protein
MFAKVRTVEMPAEHVERGLAYLRNRRSVSWTGSAG